VLTASSAPLVELVKSAAKGTELAVLLRLVKIVAIVVYP
jgi:hypothetical protein